MGGKSLKKKLFELGEEAFRRDLAERQLDPKRFINMEFIDPKMNPSEIARTAARLSGERAYKSTRLKGALAGAGAAAALTGGGYLAHRAYKKHQERAKSMEKTASYYEVRYLLGLEKGI